MKRTAACLSIVLGLALLLACTDRERIRYPETRKADVVDDYHGTKVPDPYRWLEDLDSDETAAWVRAQNEVTFAFLEAIPGRDRIAERLTELWNYPKFTIPYRLGGRYVFGKNDGLQNQDVIYMQETLSDEPRVLLDPNGFSEDGTIALANLSFSENGRYMMYGTSASGSDWQTLRVRDMETGNDLPDKLEWIKFAPTAWTSDGEGFFYARFDAPREGQAYEDQNKNQKVYYHRVGTPQSEDELVYARPDNPELGFEPSVTDDGRYLVVIVSKGSGPKVAVHYADLSRKPWTIERLLDEFDAEYALLGAIGDDFYFLTTQEAKNRRVVAVDLRRPAREEWREIIPEGDAIIEAGTIVDRRLVVQSLVDVKARLAIHELDGSFVKEIDLPGIGSINVRGLSGLRHLGGLSGLQDGTELFYGFTSFAYPTTVFRYDFETGLSEVFRAPGIDFDPSPYEVKQVFYESGDGTRVPMFVVHRKGIPMDGSNPAHIYAYGGFNYSITPFFSVANLVWIEMGGIYALANLRGGAEYGERWHEDGILEKKQNGIDDFIAAAEYLIAEGYTSPAKLSIEGASNGGLMTAACLTQRPDLFGGVLVDVGVLDMLRYHTWTIGWAWASDYGTSDDPEQFRFLYKYSPLHNLKPGASYPATLVLTADHDDRVVPSHSFKFAAALQEAQEGGAPVLIRIDVKAGHGGGKPTSKRIQEQADCWAFLAKALGIEVKL
ncbi:MAG: prolyl oligopeptidase family serine peptidase [Candidatus Eisenbacteria bacterium]